MSCQIEYPITTDFGLHTEHVMAKRAALYVRVSTDRQTVENQVAALSKVAEARGWKIVETFNDAGISGAKGRKDRLASKSC
jgi:predicted site-specific integrase-resolvase